MIYWLTAVGFVTASFAIAMSPGPSWIYVIDTTIRQGRSAGFIAVAGNGTGICCHTLAAAFGLSSLLAYSSSAFTIAKMVGAAYLTYLGVRMMWREPNFEMASKTAEVKPAREVFREGMLVNLLNPKVALLMLALLPQLVDPTIGNTDVQTACFGLMHVAIASLVLSSIVIAISHGTGRLRAPQFMQSALRYLSGSILIAFGLGVAVAARP